MYVSAKNWCRPHLPKNSGAPENDEALFLFEGSKYLSKRPTKIGESKKNLIAVLGISNTKASIFWRKQGLLNVKKLGGLSLTHGPTDKVNANAKKIVALHSPRPYKFRRTWKRITYVETVFFALVLKIFIKNADKSCIICTLKFDCSSRNLVHNDVWNSPRGGGTQRG